jgi:hypothetical protein
LAANQSSKEIIAMSDFNPNTLKFDACTQRIKTALQLSPFKENTIITSRDEGADKLREALRVKNIPPGFSKWQLPLYFDKPTHLFISVAAPGSVTPEHSHDEGSGLRFIASGSINYKGKELNAGDWMFIPAGAKYSFTTGPLGATMFYCYACCCA